MERARLIRDYENIDLPIEKRVPSLARRFPCLRGAPGLDPFLPDRFSAWVLERSEGSQRRYAGLLILNLLGKGSWPPFDVIHAISVFDEENRMILANWVRSWH